MKVFHHYNQIYPWKQTQAHKNTQKKNPAFYEKNTLSAVKHGGGTVVRLGLRCSWWAEKHFTDRWKNGFHQIPAYSESKHHSIRIEGNTEKKQKRGWLLQQDNDPRHDSQSLSRDASLFWNCPRCTLTQT